MALAVHLVCIALRLPLYGGGMLAFYVHASLLLTMIVWDLFRNYRSNFMKK